MQTFYRQAESLTMPPEIDTKSSSDGIYIRRNIKQVTGSEGVKKYQYQEAFLSFDQYEAYSRDLLVNQINGEDNSQEFENYKKQLDNPIKFTNGHFYKAKWIGLYASIIKDFKDILELYKLAGGDITEYLKIKTNIYDTTGQPEQAVEMGIKEIIELYLFLYSYKEQCFNEYKQAAAGD